MAIDFAGVNPRLSRATTVPSNTVVSVSLWCYADNTTPGFKMLYGNDNAAQYFQLGWENSGSSVFLAADAGAGAVTANIATMVAGQWYWFGFAKNGSAIQWAWRTLANNKITSGVATGFGNPTTGTYFIGNDGFSNEQWDGKIENVKIWSGYALTLPQLIAESKQKAPKWLGGLHSFYPLISASSQTIDFYSGKTLTAGGTLTTFTEVPLIPWKAATPEIIVGKLFANASTYPGYYSNMGGWF